jgi:hypothetical protein
MNQEYVIQTEFDEVKDKELIKNGCKKCSITFHRSHGYI